MFDDDKDTQDNSAGAQSGAMGAPVAPTTPDTPVNDGGVVSGDTDSPSRPPASTEDQAQTTDDKGDEAVVDNTPELSAIGDPTPPPDTSLGSSPVVSPVADDKEEEKPVVDVSGTNGDNDDLLDIKKNALQQLDPLVGHLDQSPEEKFRTTMMLIQASDDHTKIKEAFEAAKQIKDDKERAQALLDVINEINYFSQQKSDQ